MYSHLFCNTALRINITHNITYMYIYIHKYIKVCIHISNKILQTYVPLILRHSAAQFLDHVPTEYTRAPDVDNDTQYAQPHSHARNNSGVRVGYQNVECILYSLYSHTLYDDTQYALPHSNAGNDFGHNSPQSVLQVAKTHRLPQVGGLFPQMSH